MRRHLCIAALFASVVALAACGGSEDAAAPVETPPVGADTTPAPPAPEPDPEPKPEPAPEPAPEPEPEPVALNKNEYIVEADALCAELNARTDALGEPETFEEIVAWASGFIELAEDGVPRLQAIEPPADDRAGADATMALLFEQADVVPEIREAAEAGDAESINALLAQVVEISEEADTVALDYGFRECGVDDEPEEGAPVDAAPAQDNGDLQLIYVPSENEALQSTIVAVQDSGILEALVEGVNETLALPRDIKIFVEEQTPGPSDFPEFNEIVMPPEFVDLVFTVFEQSGLVETFEETRDLTLATLAFVFMHEVGHALTSELQLPITGREEDAADQLATVIVTSAGEEAGGIAIAAATLFGLFGADREQFQEADFWDEHSLDEQRFFNILCWVFGSDPATYGDAVAESGIGEDRLVRCEGEWDQLSTSWETLLAPHVK